MTDARSALFCAIAVLSLSGCGASPAQNMAAGDEARAQHRFEEARRDYLAVLRKQPGNAKAMEALVRTYVDQEDGPSAKGMLDRMAQAGVTPSGAHVLRAETDLLLNRYAEALREVAGLDGAEAWYVRSQAQLGLHQPEQAEAAFQAGMKAKGKRARLIAQYANVKMGEGQLDAAGKLIAQALREDPNERTVLLMNAALAMARHDYPAALKLYELAQKVYPESRDALLGRIGAMAEMGWYDQARPLIAQGRGTYPDDNDFLYLQARLAAQEGNWDEVRSLLQPLEATLDTMPLANALYANAQIHLGQAELARTRMTAQLLRMPGDHQTTLLLGEAKLATGDFTGALDTLQPVSTWPDAGRDDKALLTRAQKAVATGSDPGK